MASSRWGETGTGEDQARALGDAMPTLTEAWFPASCSDHQIRRYPVHHLGTTVITEDPDHSASSVDSQISGGKMDGFVASYAATLLSRGVEGGDPAPIMGYYSAADVPVFDHLASEFAVCDRW